MHLTTRIKYILFDPRTEWRVIAAEPGSVRSLLTRYLAVVATVPAVAAFVGLSVIGPAMSGSDGASVLGALIQAGVVFAATLSLAWLLACIVDALAPRFGGRRNFVQAFKLVAFGSTATLLAGVCAVVPMLALLGLVGVGWSAYLFYLGAPAVMRCPRDRALAYTAVVVLCGIFAGALVVAVAGFALDTAGLVSARAVFAFPHAPSA